MRSGLVGGGIFVFISFLWSLYDPLVSLWHVRHLGPGDPYLAEREARLMYSGDGARWALRLGLEHEETRIHLRCARLLALLGDDHADLVLIETLSKTEAPDLGALTEALLLSVWDRRKGPERQLREVAMRTLAEYPIRQSDLDRIEALLNLHPAWTGGYLLRGNAFLRTNAILRAQNDALTALRLDPYHFDAAILLGRCLYLQDLPGHAVEWFERAIRINPRIYASIQEEYDEARSAAAIQVERERIERRYGKPAV